MTYIPYVQIATRKQVCYVNPRSSIIYMHGIQH